MTTLSPRQREALQSLHRQSGISYAEEWNRTYLALNDRNLVHWHHKYQKYGKGCWVWTPIGARLAITLFGPVPSPVEVGD